MRDTSIEEKFRNEGYVFCGKDEVNERKFKYICPKGHSGSVRTDHWNRGVRCSVCAGNAKLDIVEVKSRFESAGYVLLTKEYKNSKQVLTALCPEGHKYEVSMNNWSQGYRCSTCSNRAKKTIDFIKTSISEDGYALLSDAYLNNKSKIKLECPNAHIYEVSWDNWNSKNSRCPKCQQWGQSIQENELFKFLKTTCTDIKAHDRSVLSPLELDMVIPSKKIAIEYCGLYWHSELMGKGPQYHLNKLKACEEKGYRLITVFEDELVSNKDLLFSRLLSIVNPHELKKIYARKCCIKNIESKTASKFCNENHLQGYGIGASVCLGAFYNDSLVGVMTFAKPSLAKGQRGKKEGVWELSRFCTATGYRIIGLSSKLLKFFVRNYEFNSIFSYADRRWSSGNMYEKIGFSLETSTKPNYWYFSNNKKRLHRFALRKHKEDSKSVTEWVLRKSQGWNRIWDCGSLKYTLEKEP